MGYHLWDSVVVLIVQFVTFHRDSMFLDRFAIRTFADDSQMVVVCKHSMKINSKSSRSSLSSLTYATTLIASRHRSRWCLMHWLISRYAASMIALWAQWRSWSVLISVRVPASAAYRIVVVLWWWRGDGEDDDVVYCCGCIRIECIPLSFSDDLQTNEIIDVCVCLSTTHVWSSTLCMSTLSSISSKVWWLWDGMSWWRR